MKQIELNAMTNIVGGDLISAACTGYNVGSAVYSIGVLANWWNPVGWVGGTILAVTNVACLAYTAKH
ncbi:MAG: hypothetical protein MH132_12485 [Hydrotalea sp.]|nr:hypothetical protein [Hydrotalea sp.]